MFRRITEVEYKLTKAKYEEEWTLERTVKVEYINEYKTYINNKEKVRTVGFIKNRNEMNDEMIAGYKIIDT